jgi:hypothetical protein
MIDDLDRTIRELLTQEMPRVARGEVDVSFHQPNRDWKRDKAALNFFLYDLRQNPTLRQQQWEEMTDRHNRPLRQNHRIPMQRTPLRMDCFYMVTAWSSEPLDEHRLLTECLMTLARYPVLNRYETTEPLPTPAANAPLAVAATGANGSNGSSGGVNGRNPGLTRRPLIRDYLVGALRDLEHEIPTRLAQHDVMTNPAEIWGSLENSMKAALSYIVTLPIRPWVQLETPAVETAKFLIGPTSLAVQSDPATGQPMATPQLQRITSGDTITMIGGLVLDALQNNAPVADVEVQIKGTGLFTRTDEQGRFRFAGIWFGEEGIVLVVNPNSERPTEKRVPVPPAGGEHYDVIINIVQEVPAPKQRRKGS